MADKILYIIRGVPGSGKSTLAHKLSPIVVEADDFMMVDGEYKYDPKKVHYCHKKCFETVENHLKNGEPIVAVANTFIKKSLYAPYVDLANEYGYKVIIRKADGNYQNIHNVPADVVNTMRKRFQECMNEVTENDDKNYYMDAMVGNDSLSMAKLLSNGNEHTGLLRETLKKVSDESYVMEITSYNDIKPFIKRYCSFGARGVLNTNNNKVYLADSMALTHGDMVDDLIKNGEQIDYDSIIRFMVYPTYETAIDSEYGEYWNTNEDNRIDFLTNKDLYVLFKQYSFMNDRLNKILKLDTMEDVEKDEYLNENVVYRGYDKKYGVITHPDWIYVTEDLEQARYYASKDGSVKNGGVIEYDIDNNLYFLTLDEVNEYMSEYDEEYTLNDLLWYQQGLSDYLINYGDGIKFQDPYFSNHTVYILFDTDYLKNGKEINLNESIAYAEMNDDDMMVILHNPTRKELKDNHLDDECRIIYDGNNGYYFASSEWTHEQIEQKLQANNLPYAETSGEFYYYQDNLFATRDDWSSEEEYQEYKNDWYQSLKSMPYVVKSFGNFKVEIFKSEYLSEEYEGLNRIAGFYWFDRHNWLEDGHFQLLKRKPMGVEELDPEDNEFDYYHLDDNGLEEDNKARFGIEKIGKKIVCYIESISKNHCLKAKKAIQKKFNNIVIDKFQLSWGRDGFEELDESVIPEQVPEKLYHATFSKLLRKIKKCGYLGNSPYKLWSDSNNKYVYLATDPDEAYSYAETALDDCDNERLYDMLEDDDIVILEIDTKYLDKNKLFRDENVIDGETTYQYEGIINCQIMKIYKPTLNEELIYAERSNDYYDDSEYQDMTNVILKNPSRKELIDNGMIECRIVKDWNDNFYFANSYEMIHTDIVDKLESENITSVETNLFYDTNSNTFYYNVGHLTDDEIKDFSEREEKELRHSSYISKTFKDFHFKIIFGEL